MTQAPFPSTVLLVEDNEDNRGIIRQLAELMEVTLLEAGDGEEGVKLAREANPDLILMDLSLPVLNGWDATSQLKGDPRTRDIPIVVMTAHAMAADERRAFEAGCDAYVTKPVSLGPLQTLLETFLAGKTAR